MDTANPIQATPARGVAGPAWRPIPSNPDHLAVWREAERRLGVVSDPLFRAPGVEAVYRRLLSRRRPAGADRT